MIRISNKVKQYIKRTVAVTVLSVVVFFAAFYLVNFDFGLFQTSSQISEPIQKEHNTAEFKQRIGAYEMGFAGFSDWAKANNLKGLDAYDSDPDGDGLANYLEYVHGTDPNNPDTDNDGFSDRQEIINGYDPVAPGDAKPVVMMQIEKIGVEAPMIWSQSDNEKDMLTELENGISHFWKTAAPGQVGNAVISGHSSNYIWAKGDYNHIFKDLNNLEKGDVIIVKIVQKNGRSFVYHYEVSDKFTASPDDVRIFAETTEKTLTLSTCWPLGTTFKRLVIKTELIK